MQTIHRGDVVVYEEQGVENKVMGAVLGFKTARTRTDTCIVHVQVQLLYSFHELLGIVDRLQHYRSNQILRHVDRGAENRELSADENFNYVTTIQANHIHKILNLAFHPETVENVAPDGSTWPSAANVSRVQPTCLKYLCRNCSLQPHA